MRLPLLVLLLSSIVAAGCFAQDKPSLKQEAVGEETFIYDFGQVKAGSVQEHTFILENKTAKILTIKNTSTSCGCAASEVKKKVLRPGENAEIEVKFNSKGYSGAVQQFVYVATDDLDNPVVKYIIKADVVK